MIISADLKAERKAKQNKPINQDRANESASDIFKLRRDRFF